MRLYQYLNEQYKELDKKYPLAGSTVDGRRVLKHVDNMNSISATLDDYTVLKGIRKVKMKEFDGPRSVFYAKDDFDRARDLAEKIKQSKQISPLIIVIDNEGPYILEGAHRYVALYYLKAKELPALLVVDDELYEATKVLKVYKNKRDGIESHVAKVDRGYSVSLKDTDANQFLGVSKIFPNEKDAHKYAKEIIA